MSKFDVVKARKVADDFMEFLEPEDKSFLRVGLTIRAACNAVDDLAAKLAIAREALEHYAEADCWPGIDAKAREALAKVR